MKVSRSMAGQTLTRADLAEAVMQKIGLPRKESQDMVEFVLDEICGSLERGEGVKLSSFGTFGIREKGERLGRNPKTGETIQIPAGRKVSFKPSLSLKKLIKV